MSSTLMPLFDQVIELPNLVIHASAGTGKTYCLSNRYLRLVLDGVPPDEILATTFTRKAAGEILDRVVGRLAEAAVSEGKRNELATALQRDLTRSECEQALCCLTRHLHRLRIDTLDAFFIEVAQSFRLELDLPFGWTIAEETDESRWRMDAIHRLLGRRQARQLLRLIETLTPGEYRRSVYELILETVSSLFQVYSETTREAWHSVPRAAELSPDELAGAVDELSRGLVQLSGQASGGSLLCRAIESDIEQARLQQWDAFVSTGIAAKICAGTLTYRNQDIPTAIVDLYRPLLQHARAVVLNRLAVQTESTHHLLAAFGREVAQLQAERRAIRFDDVTRTLARSSRVASPRRIAHRLDANIAHLLLDEFQDTSLEQWSVLRSIAESINADAAGSFFCVGDAKQAIYGWRGGNAELLGELPSELPGLEDDSLDTSFRSAPVIIETVNRINRGMCDHPGIRRGQQAIEDWCSRFPVHGTARQELTGHVTLEAAHDLDDEDVCLRHAARRAGEILSRAPGVSIGILTRTNVAVGKLIYELGRKQIPASEEGGNPLTDSAAVELVLSLLQLADHPGDSAALFHLSTSPWATQLGFVNQRDGETAKRLSADIRLQLAASGFGATLTEWSAQLSPHCNDRERRRLAQLVELGFEYQRRIESAQQIGYRHQRRLSSRSTAFVQCVRETRILDVSQCQVRVMTIHQAKGLQFEVVLLPDLEMQIIGQHPSAVVHRRRSTQPIERVCRYVNSQERLLLPESIQTMFTETDRTLTHESLCVLYVAVTRPIHALHMIVRPSRPSEKSLPLTLAGLLRASLTDGQPLTPGQLAFQAGSADWLESHPSNSGTEHRPKASCRFSLSPSPNISPAVPAARCSGEDVIEQLALGQVQTAELVDSRIRSTQTATRRPAARSRAALTVAPSSLEGSSHRHLRDWLHMDNESALRHGTLIHAWFEQIRWLELGLPTDDTFWQTAQRLDILDEQLKRSLADFRRYLSGAAVRTWLAQSAYGRWLAEGCTLEVRNEQEIVAAVDDRMMAGFIDRLVLVRQHGSIIAADIIDYKTDKWSRDDAGQRKAKVGYYAPQLRAYRRAVSAMLQIPTSVISARLLFLEADIAAEVAG